MTRYKWTVIGGGPAGIAAVGRLLDYGIAPTNVVMAAANSDRAIRRRPRWRGESRIHRNASRPHVGLSRSVVERIGTEPNANCLG
jgi:cation diffusion facilitator CzcD-associated flavoprotein CzcO